MTEYANVVLAVLSLFMAILSLLSGWLLLVVRGLQSADGELGKELATLRVLVAGDYIKRGEFVEAMRAQTAQFHETMRNQTETILGAVNGTRKADK